MNSCWSATTAGLRLLSRQSAIKQAFPWQPLLPPLTPPPPTRDMCHEHISWPAVSRLYTHFILYVLKCQVIFFFVRIVPSSFHTGTFFFFFADLVNRSVSLYSKRAGQASKRINYRPWLTSSHGPSLLLALLAAFSLSLSSHSSCLLIFSLRF